VKVYGGTGVEWILSCIQQLDGSIVAQGMTGSADGDFGVRRAIEGSSGSNFICRIDTNGNLSWVTRYGGHNLLGGSFLEHPRGFVHAGHLSSDLVRSGDIEFPWVSEIPGSYDAFVIQFDHNGEIQWQRLCGGSNEDRVSSVCVGNRGQIVLAGYTESHDGDFSGMNKGTADVFVIILDSNGIVVSKKTYGGSDHDFGESIAAMKPDGYRLIAHTSSRDGDFMKRTKSDAPLRWYSLALDSMGSVKSKQQLPQSHLDSIVHDGAFAHSEVTLGTSGCITATAKNQPGVDVTDIQVTRRSAAGRQMWSVEITGPDKEELGSLIRMSDGGFTIVGGTSSNDGFFRNMSRGGSDIFVVRLDSSGKVLWKRTFGGRGNDRGDFVFETPGGQLIVIGTTFSDQGDTANDGDFDGLGKGDSFLTGDIFIMKLDSYGHLVD
jgi:hypothetical protein